MKQFILFLSFIYCSSVWTQHFLNDLVIDRTMTELHADYKLGSTFLTEKISHVLDSLNVTKIVVTYRLPESSQNYSVDTLIISNGEIIESIRYMDSYKAKYDQQGRLLEKYLYFEPNHLRGILNFTYDSLNFPIYSLYVSKGISWNQNDELKYYKGIQKERFAKPYYNVEGVLDSVEFYCSDTLENHTERIEQTSFKNGDSVVIVRELSGFINGYERTDFIIRTVFRDTVQIDYYSEQMSNLKKSTRKYVNGLLVEKYSRGSWNYTYVSTYNRFGLPDETFGTNVTNDGCGNALTVYEYYTDHPRKKDQFRKLRMK